MKATYDADMMFGTFAEKTENVADAESTAAVLKAKPSRIAGRSGMAGRPAASRARCRFFSMNWQCMLRHAYSGWPVFVSASATGR